MRKIIISAIAVIAAATLCACGSSSTVNEAVNAAKQKKIENMSYEAASGNYTLFDMTDIGSGKANIINEGSYTENAISLSANGEYTLTVAVGESVQTKTGTYQIADNGVVTLDKDTFVASKAEEILCDGETLIFEGKLGSQKAVSLVYKKQAAEDKDEQTLEVETEITEDVQTPETEG